MAIQDLTDEDQSQSLSVGLGGEEGGEQLGFGLLVDALSIVRDLHTGWIGEGLDDDATFPDRLLRLLALRAGLGEYHQECGGIYRRRG